ncbi:MAG: hypothetical protein HC880_09050 [Bacteroidia bacterium]|nr:hypothetical protein [Bacteroidia bacterium]
MELASTQSETSPCGGYHHSPTGVKAKIAEDHTGTWSLSWVTRNTISAQGAGQDFLEANIFWEIATLDLALGVLACNLGQSFWGNLVVDWVRIRKLAVWPPSVLSHPEQDNSRLGELRYFFESAG